MSVTITHDPETDPNGCGTCPLFIEGDRRGGFDRDGYCAVIAAGHGGRKRLASTVRDEDGRLRFAPDPDCPLRNGGVNVRGPETVPAGHHEPARGDAVRGDWEHAWMVLTRARDEARRERDALRVEVERLTRERDEAVARRDRAEHAAQQPCPVCRERGDEVDAAEQIAVALGLEAEGTYGFEMLAAVKRLTERLGYYERGHYDGLLADLRRRLEATEAKR